MKHRQWSSTDAVDILKDFEIFILAYNVAMIIRNKEKDKFK